MHRETSENINEQSSMTVNRHISSFNPKPRRSIRHFGLLREWINYRPGVISRSSSSIPTWLIQFISICLIDYFLIQKYEAAFRGTHKKCRYSSNLPPSSLRIHYTVKISSLVRGRQHLNWIRLKKSFSLRVISLLKLVQL